MRILRIACAAKSMKHVVKMEKINGAARKKLLAEKLTESV